MVMSQTNSLKEMQPFPSWSISLISSYNSGHLQSQEMIAIKVTQDFLPKFAVFMNDLCQEENQWLLFWPHQLAFFSLTKPLFCYSHM